jgi:hypothetical protein
MSTEGKFTRFRIEIVGDDVAACRRVLRRLCDMIDEGNAVAGGYIGTIEGSASYDVDTLNTSVLTPPPDGATIPT